MPKVKVEIEIAKNIYDFLNIVAMEKGISTERLLWYLSMKGAQELLKSILENNKESTVN